MVKWGAAKPKPQVARSARPSGILSGLHPDLQRPPSHPSPSFGGLGSAALLRSMSAEDGFNMEKCGPGRCSGQGRRFPPQGARSSLGLVRGFQARGGDDPWNGGKDGETEAKQEQLTAMRHTRASCDWLGIGARSRGSEYDWLVAQCAFPLVPRTEWNLVTLSTVWTFSSQEVHVILFHSYSVSSTKSTFCCSSCNMHITMQVPVLNILESFKRLPLVLD